MTGRFHGADGSPQKREAALQFLDIVVQATRSGMLDEIQRAMLLNRLGALLGMTPQEVAGAFERRTRVVRPAGPRGATQEQVARPAERRPGVWEQAQRIFLTVLLNEPALLHKMEGFFDPDQLPDEGMRQLGREARELALELEEFRFEDDLLPRLHDERVAALAVALHEEGLRLGNYEQNVAAAVESLVSARESQQRRALAETVVARGPADMSEEGNEAMMQLYRRRAR